MAEVLRVSQVRGMLSSLGKSDSVVEVGKHQWQQIISQCHDPLFEECRGNPDLYQPRFKVRAAYDRGEIGSVDYSFVGEWAEPCFWFVYDSQHGKCKIWTFEGQLGDITDCLLEMPVIDSTIASKKLQRWIVNIRGGVSYCDRGGLSNGAA